MRLPAGTRARRIGSVTVVAAEPALSFIADVIRRHGRLRDWAAGHAVRTFPGRGATHVVHAPGGAWVVRPALRGGVIARVLRDRYVRIGAPRPIREMRISRRARDRGIDTPEVVAGVVYGRGLFYRADVVTRFVPDAMDLASLSLGPDRPAEAQRVEGWRVAGQLIRVAARAGLFHPDLNLRNVLVSWSLDVPRAHLLDLDRCRFALWLTKRDRDAMVRRFHRSRNKLEAAAGLTVSAAELAAFEEALRV